MSDSSAISRPSGDLLERLPAWLRGLLLTSASLFIFFFLIPNIPLWSSDEGRFAEIAREMLQIRDFIVPQFNYVDYLEKPVMAAWTTAGFFAVFGISSLTARLTSILAALAGVWLCRRFARKYFGARVADTTVLILLSSIGFVVVGRFAVIDMLMTLILSATMFSLFAGYQEKNRKYYLLAYVLMGLGFLTKGLIAMILPGLIFGSFLLWAGDLKEIRRMHVGWGLLIIAAIITPWMSAIMHREPDFFYEFIIKHHFKRFATEKFGRVRPVWFFAPILLGMWFPWSLFLPSAALRGLRRPAPEALKIKFLICWTAVIFIFFSIPSSKLPYYLVPLSMPLAMLTAVFFSEKEGLKDGKLLQGAWSLALFACCALPIGMNGYLLSGFARKAEAVALVPLIQIFSWPLLALAVWGILSYRRGQTQKAFAALVLYLYVGLIGTAAAMLWISPHQSTYDFAQFLKTRLQPGDHVAIMASPDHYSDLPFHLRQRIVVVGGNRGTLGPQSNKPDHLEESRAWFWDDDVFARKFNGRGERIYLLLKKKKIGDLNSIGISEYKVLKTGGGKILVSNEP